MPQNKKSASKNSWEVDFVDVLLSKDQKAELVKWDQKGEVTFDAISRLIDDGYKLSVVADKAHDCVLATLTERGDLGGIRKRCLPARGPDVFGAFKALIFKHSIILEGDWGSVANNNDGDSRWG